MIIDIHTHINTRKCSYDMPLEMLLDSMKKYNIYYSLVSDISCGESQTKEDGTDYQIEINRAAINAVRPFSDKLGIMLWCRPNAENGFTDDFEALYLENSDIVKGLKIHPDIQGLPFNDKKVFPYLKMAEKYNLPVLIHTQETEFSSVGAVVKVAKLFPDVKFILGHMSLCDDKTQSINAIKTMKNIYGDTAWVNFKDVEKACEAGIDDKILFGTDSPINGIDTYKSEYYILYYENAKTSKSRLQKIFCDNAKSIFKI